jgi:hypothetical protein
VSSSPLVSPGKQLWIADEEAPADYAGRIADGWRRAASGMIELARLCAEADGRLTPAQKRFLVERLPFDRPTFSKLVRVGRDARLRDPSLQALVPPHYTVAYPVSRLTDEELDLAVGEGVIHPGMTRSGLQRWLRARREPRPTTPDDGRPAGDGLLDRLRAAWDAAGGLKTLWAEASPEARERFVYDVLGYRPAATAERAGG